MPSDSSDGPNFERDQLVSIGQLRSVVRSARIIAPCQHVPAPACLISWRHSGQRNRQYQTVSVLEQIAFGRWLPQKRCSGSNIWPEVVAEDAHPATTSQEGWPGLPTDILLKVATLVEDVDIQVIVRYITSDMAGVLAVPQLC